MSDWKLPDDLPKAKQFLKKGYSIGAMAMQFGAVGTDEYYEAYEKLGGKLGTGCPYCGAMCMGTGDCNCQEE